LQCHLKK